MAEVQGSTGEMAAGGVLVLGCSLCGGQKLNGEMQQ